MVIFKEKHIFQAHQESILQSSSFASDIQDHHRVGYENILPLFLKLRSGIASEVWRSGDPNHESEQNKSPDNAQWDSPTFCGPQSISHVDRTYYLEHD
jgi:hypothetical protein